MNSKNFVIIGLIGVFGVGLLFVFVNILTSQSATTTSSTSSSGSTVVVTQSSSSSSSSSSASSASGFKDGTYNVTTTYDQPDGTDNISVSLTIKDGLISAVKDTFTANNRDSRQYQSMFESAISSKVVGKKLDSLSLSRVGGASLTTNGFNDALDAIIQKAKA